MLSDVSGEADLWPLFLPRLLELVLLFLPRCILSLFAPFFDPCTNFSGIYLLVETWSEVVCA